MSISLRLDSHLPRERSTSEHAIEPEPDDIGAAVLVEIGVFAVEHVVADRVRKHGVPEAALYNWKAKYGGLEVSAPTRSAVTGKRSGIFRPGMIVSGVDDRMQRHPAPSRPRTRCSNGARGPGSSGIRPLPASRPGTHWSKGWAWPAFGPNGWMRDELLNETQFASLAHAREKIAAWAHDRNTGLPRSA